MAYCKRGIRRIRHSVLTNGAVVALVSYTTVSEPLVNVWHNGHRIEAQVCEKIR